MDRIDALKIFVRLVESGSFSAVARELGVGQPTAIRIDGTFDRTGLPDPLLMHHSFRVADGKIAELKVTFAPSRAAG